MSGYQFTIRSVFAIYSPLCETIIEPPVAAHVSAVMLVSQCGEYMANGLTNAVRHEFVMMANDRQTFVAVRKHSRSFCGVSNVMLVSPVANAWRMGLRMQFAINSQ